MKHLKTFENNTNILVGDYVVCDETGTMFNDSDIIDFINNNVGRVVEIIKYQHQQEYPYMVKYANIPHILVGYFRSSIRGMATNDIIYHSKNKEDAKTFLTANKYKL